MKSGHHVPHWLLAGLIAICNAVMPSEALARDTATHPSAALNQAAPAGIEPKAGTWKTWVLKSGSELRPAAPPDKAATDLEIKELQKLATQRDAKTLTQIAYWDAGSPS